MEQGFVQVYTGDGKGKTTAATGLTVRALGQGFRVLLIRFLKCDDEPSGELLFLKGAKNLQILSSGIGILGKQADPEAVRRSVRDTFARVRDEISSGGWDLVVLDEINNVLAKNLLPLAEVLNLIDARPPEVELVLTGRHCPAQIIEQADLVTRMEKVKHPFDRGIGARRGIEY